MRLLQSLSKLLDRAELVLACTLALMIAVLILLNIVTRSMGQAIYWVDEAAIACMVWMGLLGASISVASRNTIAVTLVPDLAPALRRTLTICVDCCVLIFAAVLLVLVWKWFDPVGLMRSGFDTQAFAGNTFNFIYTERTTTLGIPKYLLWLIMPIFAVCLTVHALNNLAGSVSERDAESVDESEASVI